MESSQRRFFTYESAMALLPDVQRLLQWALDAKRDQLKAANDLRAYRRKLVMAGGAFPNANRMGAYEDQARTSHENLKSAVDRIAEMGIEVKDIDRGLVDFPTRYAGEAVYLCYELGEERITHWHGETEGFQGRKEIDAHFMEYHRGD